MRKAETGGRGGGGKRSGRKGGSGGERRRERDGEKAWTQVGSGAAV